MELLRLRLNALVSTKTIYMTITNNDGLILSLFFILLLVANEENHTLFKACSKNYFCGEFLGHEVVLTFSISTNREEFTSLCC